MFIAQGVTVVRIFLSLSHSFFFFTPLDLSASIPYVYLYIYIRHGLFLENLRACACTYCTYNVILRGCPSTSSSSSSFSSFLFYFFLFLLPHYYPTVVYISHDYYDHANITYIPLTNISYLPYRQYYLPPKKK